MYSAFVHNCPIQGSAKDNSRMNDLREIAEGYVRAPLEETNVSFPLCRMLKRAGYATLLEAFNADESDIREIVGKSFSEFTILVDSYYDHLDRFVGLMQREKAGFEPIPTPVGSTVSTTPRRCRAAIIRDTGETRVFVSDAALNTPYGQKLKDYQGKAKQVFDGLCDRHETVLVYQAFPAFSIELEDIRDSFLKLFAAYPSHPAKALAISEKFLPDIFMVFTADLARDTFSDDNLWGNFFEILPLNQNAQIEFKKLFVRLLEVRGMPLYAQDEAAHYYFYTTLLHGGLSEDSWEDLWETSLMPMAKALRRGGLGYGGEMSGYSILQKIKSENGRYTPKQSVLRILQKAPDSTIASMFESAMKVAERAETRLSSRDEYVLVDNAGLPEIALVALHNTTEKRSPQRVAPGARRQRQTASPRRKFVDLPSADLCLDLDRGIVLIRWSRKQYPDAFLGDRIDFYVDGTKVFEQYFESRLNKCILDDVEIEVSPQARYDVELRLMKRVEDEEACFEQKSSLEQSFLRSKPGCFEFIRGIDGVFHLRGRNDRITRRRRIAYILNKDYYIDPGIGMSTVSEHEVSQSWEGTSVFLFDVDPGASGAIYRRNPYGKDEEVAVWLESYRAHVNKHRVIGETEDGLDLYGYVPCKHGDNARLPYIVIEAADGPAAFDDLSISCNCNGKSVSVPRKVLWQDTYGTSSSSQIALPLELTSEIDWHAEYVEINARQISTGGKVVFRYRFAIVPIQEFKLEEAHVENGVVVAQYSFHPRQNLYVTDENGITDYVGARQQYWKRTLLKDEFLPLIISSEDGSREVHAKLVLAALDVKVPDEVLKLSEERPLCLADAINLGTRSGAISIKALGWRYNRNLIVALRSGFTITGIFLFKELKQPIEHLVNLFSHAEYFVPSGDGVRECPLVISIDYGNEEADTGTQMARTDVEILKSREGVGFKSYKVLSDGVNLEMRFDAPVLCNLRVSFRTVGRRPCELGEVSMTRGETTLLLPEETAYAMRTGKNVVATVCPKSKLGKPRTEYSFDLPLRG